MTRSEAAKICQSIKFILENSDYTEAVEEALDMAIAALKQLSLPKIIIRQGEQEPCEYKRTDKRTETHACDCISRQAAIDALYDKGLSMTAWGELLAMKWSDIQKCIEQLPSAGRPKGHWIRKQEKHQTAVCSNCEKVAIQELWGTTLRYYDFCPNCGARMESDEE